MFEYIIENRVQPVAIIGSVFFLIFILELIRKKAVKEEYSLLWLFCSFIFILFSIWREGLDFLADLIGIDYAPAALLLLLIIAIILIMIQFSMVISKLAEHNKILTQELAILKEKIDRLQGSK